MVPSSLWIPITLAAAAFQTARNATQNSLIAELGVAGAAQVRFLFGLPFAALMLAAMALAAGQWPPALGPAGLFWAALAGVSQILAMVLQLSAMRRRSFSVVTAMAKTEPVMVAILSVAFLGEALGLGAWAGIALATAGVVAISIKGASGLRLSGNLDALALGAASGLGFAGTAVCFRMAILTLDTGPFFLRAGIVTLAGLSVQTAVLAVWLLAVDRGLTRRILATWRPSLGAGFLGAAASIGWSLGFTLTSAANVRALAVVEILMAQAVSRRLLGQAVTGRERLGMALIIIGTALLVLTAR